MEEWKNGRAKTFTKELKATLREAIKLWRDHRAGEYCSGAIPGAGTADPANNRAERGLRGAVIARKVSLCSKNERGARTYEAMKSITATSPCAATRWPALVPA